MRGGLRTKHFTEKQMIVPGTPAPADNNAAVDGRELARFQKRFNLLAASLIVLVALVYLLQTFATVLQQLLVAVFIVYMIMPPYYWLVRRGLSPLLSRICILAGIVLAFALLGIVIGSSIVDLEAKLPGYQEALNRVIDQTAAAIPGLGDKARVCGVFFAHHSLALSPRPGIAAAVWSITRFRASW